MKTKIKKYGDKTLNGEKEYLDFILNDFSCYCLAKNIRFKHSNHVSEVVSDWLKNHSRSVGKLEKTYSREELVSKMRKFKNDTEMFSNTPFRKKYGSKLTYAEMEDKWIEENL